ncbi:hypothetical protein HanXRQr2_Chr09g0368981 [Helianthus annuus]|uniref:Uncharacterized protein n=1 Tax=Helianthus annuus TaxID=4232 RepID=A0A9K3I3D0_HELAN|nr:hypothetical protein HanXRQr2_Chr09g0368981 [Helianthus annuus]
MTVKKRSKKVVNNGSVYFLNTVTVITKPRYGFYGNPITLKTRVLIMHTSLPYGFRERGREGGREREREREREGGGGGQIYIFLFLSLSCLNV